VSKSYRLARAWEPKCRAATHEDKRTKRRRTRNAVSQSWLEEQAEIQAAREGGRLWIMSEEDAERFRAENPNFHNEIDAKYVEFPEPDDNPTK